MMNIEKLCEKWLTIKLPVNFKEKLTPIESIKHYTDGRIC